MAPVYKLSASSVTGRTTYGSMLAGNPAYTIPTSYESIATVTVGAGGAANVEFTSIPGTYTHLQLRSMPRNTNTGTTGANWVLMQFNNDTGSNYTWHRIFANGVSVSADSGTAQTSTRVGISPRDGTTASVYGVGICDILDYTNTNKYTTQRSLVGRDSNGSGEVVLYSGLWLNTSAITTIKLLDETNNFAQYSHFALYGIKGAA